MGGGVFRGLTFVTGNGQDLLSPGDHGADGDLTHLGGLLSLFERAAHQPQVPGSFGARFARARLSGLVVAAGFMFGFKFFGHGADNNNTVRYNQQVTRIRYPVRSTLRKRNLRC